MVLGRAFGLWQNHPLRAVAGLATSDKGAISIDGRDVTAVEAKHRGVGMVFQHYALFPNMTVEQNLAFGLQQKKLPKTDIADNGGHTETPWHDPGTLCRAFPPATAAKAWTRDARPVSSPNAGCLTSLCQHWCANPQPFAFLLPRKRHNRHFLPCQEEAMMLGDVVAIMQSGHFSQIGPPAKPCPALIER